MQSKRRNFTPGRIISGIFKKLKINLKDVFSFPLTRDEKKIYEVKESPAKYRVPVK
ncbi:MAG: hypothetical protein WCP55_19775 [Lentisphaerota bacterium]